jgi:hypothetical protein
MNRYTLIVDETCARSSLLVVEAEDEIEAYEIGRKWASERCLDGVIEQSEGDIITHTDDIPDIQVEQWEPPEASLVTGWSPEGGPSYE